jgi:hypothetical protein
LFGHVLVGGNLLLTDVVDEGLSPVNVNHHDLLTGLQWSCVSGRGRQLRDDGTWSSWRKTPTGTWAQVEPSFDRTFATTLLSQTT